MTMRNPPKSQGPGTDIGYLDPGGRYIRYIRYIPPNTWAIRILPIIATGYTSA